MRKEEPQGRRKLKQQLLGQGRQKQRDTRETAPHDQEADANIAAAKEKPMTARCNAQSQRSNNEETRGNYNRNQNRTQNSAEMTEVNESDNMTVTDEERPGHRVLTDDVTGLCDCSNTSALEAAVRPKCDMDAEKPIDNEIANDAVCPKRDDEAAAVDEDATKEQEKIANDKAAAAKKILEENDEAINEDVEFGRLIEERRNYCKRRSRTPERSE